MRGAIRPVWSPDGRRVAFELWAQTWQGDKKTLIRDVWVVDRDGKNLRRALEGSTIGAVWSPDGTALTIEKSTEWPGGRVEVDALPSRGPEALPQPPAEILAALRATAEAKVRAGTFDVAPVLAANREWQNPSLDHLQSVQFVHKTEPIRLDERFVWRRDGAMLLDVVHFGREKPEEHVGSAWVITPRGPIHSFAPGSHYPKVEAKTAQEINAYALDHLMGTRTRFVALDWGRDPSAFEIRDVRRAEDGNTVKLELAPRSTPERRRVGINAGAMFETMSWAYVHDLYVGFAELTIETATHRIVREVDHGFKGETLCEIDLGEWIDIGEGRSVPRHLRFRFPGQQFTVDDRFLWRPERLWILKSGESRFDGKDPERETIADLAINTCHSPRAGGARPGIVQLPGVREDLVADHPVEGRTALGRTGGSVPRTVAEAFPVRPGEAQVVQVDAVPDWRSPRDSAMEPDVAPTRLRTLQFADNGRGALGATLELVSRDHWKDLVAKATLILLDDKDVPVAVGSLEHGYRVERDVYAAANLPIPLRGRTARAGAVRGVAGVQTVTIGVPMGSRWGMYVHTKPPYPIESLLAGDDPQVWCRGLAVLDDEAGTSSSRRNIYRPGDPTIDQNTWGAIHRVLRPHSDRLAALFPIAPEAGPRVLARLCLLAGYSGDERLVEPLKARLDHPDEAVRDAAATGMGLLGNSDGRARLEAIIARPDPSDAAAKSEANQRKAEAKLALKVIR